MAGPNGVSQSNGHVDDLPDSRTTSLFLTRPTEAEKFRQLARNSDSWRRALSVEAYIRREIHLASQDATHDGGINYWVLVDSLDLSTRRVLCGCETYRKRAVVASGGTVKVSIVHGVGSVFCPAEFRGRGYAGKMIKLLGEKLEKWQVAEGCPFSVLYSDIGKQFYAAYGWKAYQSTHLSLSPSAGHGDWVLPAVRPLHSADLADLCALDEKHIIESLQQCPPQAENTMVALLPDMQTIKWHHAREEFIGYELYGAQPEIKGGIIGEAGSRFWCYWTRTWFNEDAHKTEGNTLYILRIVSERFGILDWDSDIAKQGVEEEFWLPLAALFVLAQQEARKWTMHDVQLWNPHAVVKGIARKVFGDSALLVEREQESIASMKWYGDSLGQKSQDVKWIGIERYVWS